MKKTLLVLPFLVLFLLKNYAYAQITVTYPTERAVFQRNNSNEANVHIGGFMSESFQRIEARFVPRIAGEGEASPVGSGWAIIDDAPSGSHFYGFLPVKGGWYKLEVRGIRNGSASGIASVERVGVGEVFVVAGQSNATGGDSNPNGPSAANDQVNSVNFQNIGSNGITEYDSVKLPFPEFVQLGASVKTAPFGNYAWCWGSFGDKIYEKLRVPVMIFNAGWSSTGIEEWQQTIDPRAVTTGAFGYTFPRGLPFGHLRLALNNYIAQLGVRAVLCHHGETDNYVEKNIIGDPRARYRDKLWDVISASRNVSGKSSLAWVVARASRFTFDGASRVSQNVVNAQNDLINNDATYANIFQGPETDPYFGAQYRNSDEIHFRGDGVTVSPDGNVYSGLVSLAGFWADKITQQFLAQSTPYPAIPPAEVTVTQAPGGTDRTFSGPLLPQGSQYNWLNVDQFNVTLSTARQWTRGAGSYRLKIIDLNRNTVFSPRLYVSGTSLPVTWKYFNVRNTDSNRPLLQWATSEEVNASHFELERSSNAVHFMQIKTVEAAGNAKVTNQYAYREEFLPAGTYYYRIRQVDFDGKFDYSKTISAKVEMSNAFTAFPNPVAEILTIESEKVLGQMEIVSVAGKKLHISMQNTNTTTVDMSQFPPGLYTITANGASYKVIKK